MSLTSGWPLPGVSSFITARKRRSGQGNVFTGVCLSTEGWFPSMFHRSHYQGVCLNPPDADPPWLDTEPPWRQTSPGGRPPGCRPLPPLWMQTPWMQTHPLHADCPGGRGRTPPLEAVYELDPPPRQSKNPTPPPPSTPYPTPVPSTPYSTPPRDTTGYRQRSGGTHPSGMHSCLKCFRFWHLFLIGRAIVHLFQGFFHSYTDILRLQYYKQNWYVCLAQLMVYSHWLSPGPGQGQGPGPILCRNHSHWLCMGPGLDT